MKLITKFAVIAALLLGATVVTTAATAVSAPEAGASTCFKTASVSGANSIGYGRFSSLNNYSAYVRTAPVATLCIKYAKAYGGYYFASVTCSQSSARLTSDSTSLRRANNYVNHVTWTSASCGASATWKWTRTVGNDQCVSLNSQSAWGINQSTGLVWARTHLNPDGYFVPGTC